MDVTSRAAGLLEPIPANAALGIKVISAAEGCAEVSMPEAPDRANVVGSMHSSGLIALIDAASLAAVIAMSDEGAPFEDIVPLGASARLEFLAPARGGLKGRCGLDDQARAAITRLLVGQTDKVSATTNAEIHDREGLVVCRGTFDWRIRRIRPA